jgi:hypothetical protein
VQLALFLVGLAALAVLITIFTMLSLVIQQWIRDQRSYSPNQQGATNQEYNETDQRRGDGINSDRAAPTDAVAQAIHTYRHERGTYERRRSKNDQVTVVILSVTALFALLAFLASAVADVFFYGQLGEMKTARESSEGSFADQLSVLQTQAYAMQGQLNQMVLAQRPWIPAKASVTSDLRFNVGASLATFDFRFELENTGHSPAFDVSVVTYPITIVARRKQTAEVSKQTALCNVRNTSGPTIFPGEPVFHTIPESLSATNPDQDYVLGRGTPGATIEIGVLGCILYRSYGSEEIHRTPFFFSILRYDNNGRYRPINPDSGEQVPGDSLTVQQRSALTLPAS